MFANYNYIIIFNYQSSKRMYKNEKRKLNMEEIKNNKTQREYTLLKIPGILLLALVMQVNIVDGEPSENITFVTTGSSFSPIITVTGNPTIQWIFGDGSTSNSKSPTVNFGS